MDTDFSILIGKTIVSANLMTVKGYDDEGFLELVFSDGTSTILHGTYGGFWWLQGDFYG